MRKYLVLIILCICSVVSYSQNVGIGTANPQNKLHVAGGFRLDTLTGINGAGLLRHDASGLSNEMSGAIGIRSRSAAKSSGIDVKSKGRGGRPNADIPSWTLQ